MSQPKVICHIAQAQGNGYEILRQQMRLKTATEQSFLVVDIVSLGSQSLQKLSPSAFKHAEMRANVEEVPQSDVDCHTILILRNSSLLDDTAPCVPGAIKPFSFGASSSSHIYISYYIITYYSSLYIIMFIYDISFFFASESADSDAAAAARMATAQPAAARPRET